ncbi:hypothetical protein [Paenibacillus sp. NPDC057967]|uniref:hypothetical protein n=1 Tax=Paenibacillus sp. NPDC057967 TaxID=3346293 RepID=UPI0036DACA04
MQQPHENAMTRGSSLKVSDVVGLIQRDELHQSVPFMAFNRATRRTAEKQAKRLMQRLKK